MSQDNKAQAHEAKESGGFFRRDTDRQQEMPNHRHPVPAQDEPLNIAKQIGNVNHVREFPGSALDLGASGRTGATCMSLIRSNKLFLKPMKPAGSVILFMLPPQKRSGGPSDR